MIGRKWTHATNPTSVMSGTSKGTTMFRRLDLARISTQSERENRTRGINKRSAS